MKVAIIGSGLIGGSIGLGLRAGSPPAHVTVYDRDPAASRLAVERGAADVAAAAVAEAVRDSDVIFVCVPVGAVAGVVWEAASAAPEGAILTDVGSTKVRVMVEVERSGELQGRFVGGHPMAGSEDEGVAAARADLFAGAWWILTPPEDPAAGVIERLADVLTTLGARVEPMRADAHDELMAIVSHLPQLLSSALMETARGEVTDPALLALGAGGFRDVTRIAASSPAMWTDIIRENREALIAALDAFGRRLSMVRDQVERADDAAIRSFLESARSARRGLAIKPQRQDLVELHVPVPDRPGVLAEVTAIAGELGVNIEDLTISHAAGGARGVLHLSLAGATDARTLGDALRGRGYVPASKAE